jgi:serine protease Do
MNKMEELNDNTVSIAEQARKAVVSINSTIYSSNFGYGVAPVKGAGSGFIISHDGYILTNNHVIQGSETVDVVLNDGRKFNGEIVGTDPQTDVALVKIQGDDFPVMELGDSEAVKIGSIVLAIGNALGLPGGHTVSMGVISAKNRPMPWADFIFEGVLQTDAAINPGNSGGPLVGLDGKVVGINTAMIAQANGIGFSIPINTIKKELDEMIKTGKVKRKYIGISGIEVNELLSEQYNLKSKSGVMVARIDPDSPAYHAGLRSGDVILEFGGKAIEAMRDLIKEVQDMSGNIDIIFSRRGSKYRTMIEYKPKEGKRIEILDE